MKFYWIIFCFSLFFLISLSASAQDKVTCKRGKDQYKRTLLKSEKGLTEAEAQKILEEILKIDNLSDELISIHAANVANAEVCLVTYTTETPFRILFSPTFFSEMYKDTPEKWANIAILAHEVGHIIKNHFIFSDTGSTYSIEWDADIYSGVILAKLGADLKQTLSPYKSKRMREFKDSSSHPPIEKRLQAVRTGWESFKGPPLPPLPEKIETPQAEIEENARLLKNIIKEFENGGYKLQPFSFVLAGTACSLVNVKISKTEANNHYKCDSGRFVEADALIQIGNDVKRTIEAVIKEEKYQLSHEGNIISTTEYKLLNNNSSLKNISWRAEYHEPFEGTLEFLLTWKNNYTRPYLSTNPSQEIINLGKEIKTKISYLENTNISNTKSRFNLIGMNCSSDYGNNQPKKAQSSNRIKITFSCSSSIPNDYTINYTNERNQRINEIFDSVEYALTGKSYNWTYSEQVYAYSIGEELLFEMRKDRTKNILEKISVVIHHSRYNPSKEILLKFVVLK